MIVYTCGPQYICTCCDQLWYRSSVIKCGMSKYSTTCSQSLLDKCITGTKRICSTCHSNLSEGKLPACSKANKMQFPVKLDCLYLTPLEERLISPRIPFMQIRELPRGGQLSIHNNVVNVPADVSSTVSTLPRPINESQTIPIKLKRRLNYKHHDQYQNFRPTKVLEAATHLVQTSNPFQSQHIEVQQNWQDNLILSTPTDADTSNSNEWQEFLNTADDSESAAETLSKAITENTEFHNNPPKSKESGPDSNDSNKNTDNNGNIDSNDDDGWCEVEERPSGVTDTLLEEPNVTENV